MSDEFKMSETIQSFLIGDSKRPEEIIKNRLKMILDEKSSEELKSYLGADNFASYQHLAEQAKLTKHLSNKLTNLIFVPGVMGSLLYSETIGGVWWIDVRTLKLLDKLSLNDDGSDDADRNRKIRPFTTDITYDQFFTAVLNRPDFGHTIFPYDWRKSLVHSAERLKRLILDTYQGNGNQPVHLVAHSMGGLMVRATLMLYKSEIEDKIGRIVFIGTPHYGSPAIAGYLKNHLWGWDYRALLGRYISRETFRTLRGVLSLLPAPHGVYPNTRTGEVEHPCANFDLYDAQAWELGLTPEQTSHLQSVLTEVAEFHRNMFAAHNALSQRLRNKMLSINGVGLKTLFRLEFNSRFWGLWDYTDKITSRVPGDSHREGDGSVPLVSAELENVGERRYIKGEHGNLPMIKAVYEEVFRWLNAESLQLPAEPDGALVKHLGEETSQTELINLIRPPVPTDPMTGEADFWYVPSEGDPLQTKQVDQLEKKLAQGELPDLIKVKLL